VDRPKETGYCFERMIEDLPGFTIVHGGSDPAELICLVHFLFQGIFKYVMSLEALDLE
jgi:hypothetical protein